MSFWSFGAPDAFADIIVDNGGSGTSYTGTWSVSGGTDPYGANSLWARNGATYTWQFDSQPPGLYEVLMWWSAYPSRATSIDVEINHYGESSYESINQQENAGQWNSLGTYSFDSSGSVTITAAYGSTVSTCADAVWFRLISGNSPPTAYIDSISPNPAEPGQLISFSGHGDDSDGNIISHRWQSSIDGDINDANVFSTDLLSEGVHTISYSVEDDAGMWSESATEVLVVGAIPIEVIIDNRDAETSQTGTWQVSGGSEPYGVDSVWSRDGATFSWHFMPPQYGDYEVSMWWTSWPSRSTNALVYIQHADGTSPVYINQQQNGGMWNYLETYTFDPATGGTVTIVAENPYPASYCADAVKFNYIQTNETPIAIIDSIAPNPAEAGEPVTFSGHGEDPDGTIETYSWVSDVDGDLNDVNSFSTTSLSEGRHIITFRVGDNGGKWSEPVTEELIVGNLPPTAYIDSIIPNPATVGEDVTFTGDGEDSDGTIAAYRWESSIDGYLSNENSFSNSSLSQGNHIITFSVYDDDDAVSEPVTEVLSVEEVFTGAIIDNGGPGTSYTGTWSVSSGPDPYGVNSYWSRDGATYAWTFVPTVPGYYELSMCWTEWPSRSTNVPVQIEYAGGTDTVYINQQQNGGQWNPLGGYLFDSGSSYRVTITAQPSPSSTCADAVRFLYVTAGGNVPPVATIDSMSPNPAWSGETVNFAGHGSDSDGTITAYSWRSSINGYLSESDSFSRSTLSVGTHTIFFRVRDDQEAWSQEATATLSVGVEHIYVAFIYNWENLEAQYTSMLQDMGASRQGNSWTYVNGPQNKTYYIHYVSSIEGLKQALTTAGAHVILCGHANYGTGPSFATPNELARQLIEDILYIDDDRILNVSTPWIHVSVSGMRTGQAYPYWWPVFKDGTSGIMPYDFGDPRGDPAYNYYLTYQVPGDSTYYKIETVRHSAIERFSDSGRPAWYSPDGSVPDPNNPNDRWYYITNSAPWSPSFESVGNWTQYQDDPADRDDSQYFKENYIYSAVGSGNDQATWLFSIPEAGEYKIWGWWPASSLNAYDAPYTVNHALGSETVRMDQRINGRRWNEIGQFYFDANDYSVILSDDADAGSVVADGVRVSHVDNPPEVVAADFIGIVTERIDNFGGGSPRSGAAPLTITFANTSTGDLTGRMWSFGDGLTNTTRDIIEHQFPSPGTYTVSLTVSGPLGSDTKTKVNYITVGATEPEPPLQAEFVAGYEEFGVGGNIRRVPFTIGFLDNSTGDLREGITYTPALGFTGDDTFSYTVEDDDGAVSDEATVTVTVYAGNVAPVANDDSAAATYDTPVTVDVIANDIDIDGAIEPNSVVIISGPTDGTVEVNEDGTVTYSPDTGFVGTDAFTYTVEDNEAAVSNEAAVTVEIGNLSPVATADSAQTQQDTPVVIDVLANDSDSDGTIDHATVVVTVGPSNCVVAVNPDGTVTCTPNTGFNGTDTFAYTVEDNEGAVSNQATVTVDVGNLSPVANDDTAQTVEDNPVTIGVLANDSDSDGSLDPNSIVITSDPSDGAVVVNEGGTVTYSPDVGFTSSDTFSYTVADDQGAVSNEATVTINPENVPPTANDDSANTRAEMEVTVNVLANDRDSDGKVDPGTIVVTAGPSNGSIVVHDSWLWNFGDGQVSHEQYPRHTYTETGNYAVSLTVTDAEDSSVTETKQASVRAVVFEKSIDNVDYLKTHYSSKTLLFRREMEIAPEDLKYTRMLYDTCNSGNYYLGTFHQGITFYTLTNSGSRGSVQYLRAYLLGTTDEEIWEIIQNVEPSYDYYNFNELPPVSTQPLVKTLSAPKSLASRVAKLGKVSAAVSDTLSPEEKSKIEDIKHLTLSEALEELQGADFVVNETLLRNAIAVGLNDKKSEAIAFAMEQIKLPVVDTIEGRVVRRTNEFDIAKKILQVFSDETADELAKLYDIGDAVTKSNIIRITGPMVTNKTIQNMLVNALDDKTVVEVNHPEILGTPLRICDLAYNQIVLCYRIKGVLRTIGTTHRIEDRDYHINVLKGQL